MFLESALGPCVFHVERFSVLGITTATRSVFGIYRINTNHVICVFVGIDLLKECVARAAVWNRVKIVIGEACEIVANAEAHSVARFSLARGEHGVPVNGVDRFCKRVGDWAKCENGCE